MAILRIIFTVLAAVSALAAEPVPRFTDPARRAKLEAALPEVEKIFARWFEQRGAPGMVYGVVIDGELVQVKSFGVRDRTSNDPVTPDTAFRIASMTKSFTALAILKLRDEGKLSLEDPVAKWVPEFARMKYPTRDTAPIRIKELLTHGAGFPEDNPWGDRQLAIADDELGRWLERGLPFSTAPGTEFEYSNYGFALLGRIVQRASGMSYKDYLHRQILAPLGMKSTTLEPSDVPANARAIGYRRDNGEYSIVPSLAHGSFGAMGGLVTTARDMARYVAYMLSAYPPRDDQERGPVRRSSLREMQLGWRASTFSVDGVRSITGGYGYGLGALRDCRFSHVVSHGGGLPGFGSYMLWLPDYGIGFFGMTNLTYTGPAGPIFDALQALYRTGALKPRELPPAPALLSARDALTALYAKWDAAAAEALAADNLFLDQSAEVRRKELEKLREVHGACRVTDRFDVENWLRGQFRLECERGSLVVGFTLAPTQPPKIQMLYFNSIPPLSESLRSSVQNSLGACRLKEALSSNGKDFARVLVECENGPAALTVRLNADGTLREKQFGRAPGAACAP